MGLPSAPNIGNGSDAIEVLQKHGVCKTVEGI